MLFELTRKVNASLIFKFDQAKSTLLLWIHVQIFMYPQMNLLLIFFGCNTSQNHGNMVFIYLCNLIEKSNNNSSKRHRKGGRKIKMQDKH